MVSDCRAIDRTRAIYTDLCYRLPIGRTFFTFNHSAFDMYPSPRMLHALVALNLVALLTLAAPATCPAPKKIAQQAPQITQQPNQPVQQVAKNSTQAEQGIQQIAQSSPQAQDLSGQDCCGYTITNRDNAWFRYRVVTDFASASLAEITAQGWKVSHGWQAGAFNAKTGQSPIADRNNVKMIPSEGMAMTVPRKSVHLFIIELWLISYRRPRQGRRLVHERRSLVPQCHTRRDLRDRGKIVVSKRHMSRFLHLPCRWQQTRMARRARHRSPRGLLNGTGDIARPPARRNAVDKLRSRVSLNSQVFSSGV